MCLMRTVAIPDRRSTPATRALMRCVASRATLHIFAGHVWESVAAIRGFAGDEISVAKYYNFDKDFLLELEPCSTHYEMYVR